MAILHPDTNKPATVASSNLSTDTQGRLTNIDGTPSDGYSADVVNSTGQKIGEGVNYMDGNGWYLRSKN